MVHKESCLLARQARIRGHVQELLTDEQGGDLTKGALVGLGVCRLGSCGTDFLDVGRCEVCRGRELVGADGEAAGAHNAGQIRLHRAYGGSVDGLVMGGHGDGMCRSAELRGGLSMALNEATDSCCRSILCDW
jgi:hypothetical protein